MKLLSSIIIAVVTCSCAQQDKSESEPVRKRIASVIAADNKSDIESVLDCYSDAAVLVPPGRPMIEGKKAIRSNYESIFSGTRLQLTITIDSLMVSNSFAVANGYTLGQAVAKSDSSVKEIRDRYIMILQREGSEWKITRLMWSPE